MCELTSECEKEEREGERGITTEEMELESLTLFCSTLFAAKQAKKPVTNTGNITTDTPQRMIVLRYWSQWSNKTINR